MPGVSLAPAASLTNRLPGVQASNKYTHSFRDTYYQDKKGRQTAVLHAFVEKAANDTGWMQVHEPLTGCSPQGTCEASTQSQRSTRERTESEICHENTVNSSSRHISSERFVVRRGLLAPFSAPTFPGAPGTRTGLPTTSIYL